ncbi:MAG: pyruvate ferredoxin oxidoreductase [Candidatus Bathyarchaeia archaeon]
MKKDYHGADAFQTGANMTSCSTESATLRRQSLVGYNGNEAVAFAVKQCNVGVVAAYPITPQTIIVEALSQYVADGDVETEFICVESEHSALSACIGSSLAGVRVFTATASQGLALMHEALYAASGLRCPIVMAVANRALSAPINIHADHSDMMGSRDCGWIQIYVENVQEAYDWTIMAFKIAEDPAVQLPVAVNLDGFTLTHSMENLYVLKDGEVAEFLPMRKAYVKLDPEHPCTFGGLALPEYYFEIKRQQEEAIHMSHKVIENVVDQYCRRAGRQYGLIETFMIEDAEAAIMCLGSTAATARHVARELRRRGMKVGVIKLWVYRPFPAGDVAEVVSGLKALAVLDRSISFGAPMGPLATDTAVTLRLHGLETKIFDVICGLGGRDISPSDLETVFNKALDVSRTGIITEPVMYVGVRD